MGRRVYYFIVIVVLTFSMISSVLAQPQEGGLIEELKLFSKALGVIWDAYPGDVQLRQLLYEAVKGMLGSLDKFSEFIDPEKFKLLQIQIKGEYAGIGALLQTINEMIVIRALEPGKPAEKAGLQPGDIILKVDGILMEKKQVAEVSALLRGEANTPVVITILRGPERQIFDVTIERKIIEIQSVQDSRMIGKSLAYFRLSAWQDHTVEQVDKALEDFKKQGMKALIFDLRNNDGGLLPTAVSLAERFLPKGKKIVTVKSKIPEQQKEHFTTQDGAFLHLPLVVLVNEKSASASEVFTGALQDHQRVTVIGVQTFGKGSVQSVVPLDDVSAMKITTAKYATPSGKIIDTVGLKPDRVVANKDEGTPGGDLQTLDAITFFKEYM